MTFFSLLTLLLIFLCGCNLKSDKISATKEYKYKNVDYFETTIQEVQSVNNDCKLYINGKEMENVYIYINNDYKCAEIPLLTILAELGAEVIPQNEKEIKIIYNGEEFFINTEDKTFIFKEDNSNGLMLPPGSRGGTFKVVDEEVIVDTNSSRYLLKNVFDATIKIDYAMGIVFITSDSFE